MDHDFAKELRELDSAVQQLFVQFEKLRQHVETLHIECAESTKRCSELQDEMNEIRTVPKNHDVVR